MDTVNLPISQLTTLIFALPQIEFDSSDNCALLNIRVRPKRFTVALVKGNNTKVYAGCLFVLMQCLDSVSDALPANYALSIQNLMASLSMRTDH